MRYKSRAPRPCNLDPFKPAILDRVAAASLRWIPVSVVLREFRQRGYCSGYSALWLYAGTAEISGTSFSARQPVHPGQ